MEENRPGYYAVIPADVRYDDQIPANAKLLYGEISALIGPDGCCFASNAYFASLYKLSDRTISGLIGKLQEQNYIDVILKKDPKTGQVLRRLIYLKVSSSDERPLEEIFHTPRKYFREGIEDFFQDTDFSNTDLEKENKKEKEAGKPKRGKNTEATLTDEQLETLFVEWIKSVAQSSWTRETKNELFLLLKEFYAADRLIKKGSPPVHTSRGFNGMSKNLKKWSHGKPEEMAEIINQALAGGWSGIHKPNNFQEDPPEESTERRDEEWL